jgi:hypothetical protein
MSSMAVDALRKQFGASRTHPTKDARTKCVRRELAKKEPSLAFRASVCRDRFRDDGVFNPSIILHSSFCLFVNAGCLPPSGY